MPEYEVNHFFSLWSRLRISHLHFLVRLDAVMQKESGCFAFTIHTIPLGLKRNPKEKVVILEVFSAVTMKNAISRDIRAQVVPHRKNVTSLLHSPAG
jgi:hypothetical protein